jgi:hypothetical protein
MCSYFLASSMARQYHQTTRSSEHSIKEPATVTTFRAMKGYGFITPD